MKLIILYLQLFMLAIFSQAKPTSVTPELLIQGNNPIYDLHPYDLALYYNGSNYSKDIFENYSKDYLLSEIQRDSKENNKSKTEILIPFGPTLDFTDLETELKTSKFYAFNLFKKYQREMRTDIKNSLEANIQNLSEAELKLFLSKKHEYLKNTGKRLESVFLYLKIKPNYRLINHFLRSVNNTIYLSSNAFLHSNTVGVPIYLTLGFGMAFGRLFYDLIIANTPLKNKINPNFGFYFLSAFGIAVSTTTIGKRKLRSLDLFVDFESFKKALTPVLEGFGGLGFGVHFESRNIVESEKGLAKIQAHNSYDQANYIPLVGMVKAGKNDFSINHGAVVTWPIYSLFHDNHFSRKYFHITFYDSENKKDSGFKNIYRSLVSLFKKTIFEEKFKSQCLSNY
ncbi:MAG: hypothetical protein HUU56_06470 [Bdellovibrionaceae bacterium]|nr:hypothetical protein [Pseudobdellovibrionaceae bacterium]